MEEIHSQHCNCADCQVYLEYSKISNSPTREVLEICRKATGTNYTAIVISGGSTKGFLALGAIQFLLDNYYLNKIDTYVGTSIGSIIGYLLAIGCTSVEIITFICVNKIFENTPCFNFIGMVHGEGSISYNELQMHLERITVEKIGRFITFQELYNLKKRKLIVCTYNVTKAIPEYLSIDTYPEMPIFTALRMSCNLPLIFGNYKYMGCNYIDGGVADNFPIHIVDKDDVKVIGINMLPTMDGFENVSEKNLVEYIYHIIFVPILQLVKLRSKKASKNCTVIEFQHDSKDFPNPFDLNLTVRNKLNLFSKGYKHACEKIELNIKE